MIQVLTGHQEFENWLLKRRVSFEEDHEGVKSILLDVKTKGDLAVKQYTQQFDGVSLDFFEVGQAEKEKALSLVSEKLLEALNQAKENITQYHLQQKISSWHYKKEGIYLGQRVNPLNKVGIYIPGGKGFYPSSVLMTAIPAKIAGVQEIIMITPPQKDGSIHPALLVTANLCGVDRIFKAGGVQGVAALAYGTKQFPKVDKIVGPGNQYVTYAKKYLFGTIDIDSLAGPSEVMVLADENSHVPYLVADLFAQAEHSEDAQSILLVPSKEKAEEVKEEIQKQLLVSAKKEVLKNSIIKNSCLVVYQNLDQAFDIINYYAPEHLQIFSENLSQELLFEKIKNAGAIFMGSYTPVALGDYFAGPNHTLPTSGTARFASPLGVYDFVKYTSVVHYSKEALLKAQEHVAIIAETEGFFEHAKSVIIRSSSKN